MKRKKSIGHLKGEKKPYYHFQKKNKESMCEIEKEMGKMRG